MARTDTNGVNGSSDSSTPADASTPDDVQLELDALIIGTGPAGASLACFLASHGIKGLMVSRAPTNADTPRAHITNAAALECLRDIGLEDQIKNLGTKNENFMKHTRWCYSMAGREYARIYSWGNDPARKGDYERASPCKHVDLPQTLLEPALVRHATLHGFSCRFDTDLVGFVDDGARVVTTLRDRLTGATYAVRSRFLFGADGARSHVQRQLGLPLVEKPQQGFAINVLVRADLSHLMESRPGNLHWVFQPDREHPAFAWQAVVRMVKPWNEWMFILLPDPAAGAAAENVTDERYLARVRELIGDATPAEIINVSRWYINETYAETYSSASGNVHCLGDAVHRHPPFNGLGSNTCIQDAFNLAWKAAYVLQGRAGAALLSSYTAERQPVGRAVVTRANDGFREHFAVWDALGLVLPTPGERAAAVAELEAPTPAGRERRRRFQSAVAATGREFHALGVEMNQSYTSAAVVKDEGVTGDDGLGASAGVDTQLMYVPSTFPGRRLPHVWLGRAVPDGLVSTVDLAGKGRFALFTGIGGVDAWSRAAKSAEAALGVRVRVVSIGYGCEFEDPYFEWTRVRSVGEDGCVLVRPDRFVAWRAEGASGDEEGRLGRVLRRVLARE
ncbi:dichlorophenol 6-monooxygenase [Diplodia corticola]|uniref:Dichlorophenol 6-monooxygenase n=1 Tax=Diplodia corticola TaxID=236234 RepID=A0A1J9R4D2_9PEZI|nr:dichlorophenol 6-monooxygenase [Diplodia corticola]OJD35441.1 dichlorophenol 6-monooxygenase [Diplodia corticola]